MTDVSEPVKSKEKKEKKDQKRSRKITEDDFEVPALARLAKHCQRMAICIHNMYPRPGDEIRTWKLFSDELKKIASEGSDEDMLKSMEDVSSHGESRKKLLLFVRPIILLSNSDA